MHLFTDIIIEKQFPSELYTYFVGPDVYELGTCLLLPYYMIPYHMIHRFVNYILPSIPYQKFIFPMEHQNYTVNLSLNILFVYKIFTRINIYFL